MDSTSFLLSALFSLIGMAAFVYGRRQRLIGPSLIGIALMVYPYFVTDPIAMIAVGVALVIVLVVGRRWEE